MTQSSINVRDTADDANLINNGTVTVDVEGLGEVHFAGDLQNKRKCGAGLKKFMKRYCILYMNEYEGEFELNTEKLPCKPTQFPEKINSDEIKVCPPPIAIPLISILEIIFFILQTGHESFWSYE
jgi:hypothetical protein